MRTELDDWLAAAGIDRGKLFRRVNKVGKGMGRWHDGEGGLAHCEGIRKAHRRGEVGATRSATDLCSDLPCFGVSWRQIQFLLRHVSVQKRPNDILAARQRIRSAVNDHIGIEPNP